MPRSTTTSRTSTGNSAATTAPGPPTYNHRSAALPAASATPSRPTPSSRSSRLAALPADATTQSYRRARAGVWAVGVAIIAASGALLGAHLKTLYQEKERAAQAAPLGGDQADGLETTARSQTLTPDTATAQAQHTSPTTAAAAAAKIQQPAAAPPTPTNSLSDEDRRIQIQDIERAIRTLDNQRGQLVTRRMQEEGRLGNLRERMRQKAELKRQREEIAGPER